MTDILRLLSQTDRQDLSPMLALLSVNDIQNIWADISAYIERQMKLKKGVHLGGLGTFTFSEQRMDLGLRFSLSHRPVFLLEGKLLRSVGLKQSRPVAEATHLPVVQLNFAEVSQETPFSRDVVKGCVTETLHFLCRALASEHDVFLTFQGIGVLFFTNSKVRMKFNRGFVNAMDGSGRMLSAFRSRPGSSVSLLSSATSRLHRPQTTNAIAMPTICSPPLERTDGPAPSPVLDLSNTGEVAQQRISISPQKLQPVKMSALSPLEEVNPKPPTEATCTDNPRLVTFMSPPEDADKQEESCVQEDCSGHTRAGQELCYVCMQRAQRNVAVYRRRQQEAEEKVRDKLLLLREQQRDRQRIEEEQAKLSEQREHAKQVATFNLQMSEKRSKTCLLYPTSFIFPARPLTPVKRIQQSRYMKDLQSQIESRHQREARDHQHRLLMEHQDQVHLVQEIDLQKKEHERQKQERTKLYKKALDTQVEDRKQTEPPQVQTEDSRIGDCETAANEALGREQAQKLFQHNFSKAAQRKKEELLNRQAQVEKEREMLKTGRMELLMDRINRFEKRQDISRSLEDEWSHSVNLKHQREEVERRFLRSAGQLLVDKLAEYKRCNQCKRRTSNQGESSIWKDSCYLSGSQFMI